MFSQKIITKMILVTFLIAATSLLALTYGVVLINIIKLTHEVDRLVPYSYLFLFFL
jgi:hypothetical protein